MMGIASAVLKEMQEIAHDRTMLAVLLVFPIFVMLFMGSSFRSMEINGLPVGLAGATNSSFSNTLFSDLNQSKAFNLRSYGSEDEAMTAFRNGELRAVIVVPPGFDEGLLQGNGSSIKIIVDNSDLALEQSMLAAMSSVIEASSANITRSYVSGAWKELEALNESATNLSGGIASTRMAMQQTKDNLSLTMEGMDNISIDSLQGSLDNASSSISGLKDVIGQQKAALGNASASDQAFLDNTSLFIQNATVALGDAKSTVQSTHDKLASQVQSLNQTNQTLTASIAALQLIQSQTTDNTTKAALGINIASLQSLQNSTEEQLTNAQSEMADLESLNQTLDSFGAELANYSAQVDSAKAGLNQTAQLSAVLDSMSNRLDGLNASFAAADGQVQQLRALLGQIRTSSAQINSTLDSVLQQTDTVDALIGSLHQTVAEQTGRDPNIIASPLSVDVQSQYQRNSFVDFIMPQIISVSLLLSCFLLASISFVREKTRNTIVRALLAPRGLANLVIGKVISLVLMSFLQVAVIILVAMGLFGVSAPANITMLFWGTAISALVLSSIGILIGFASRSESAAIQSCLLIAIPMLFLGNIIFSPDLLPIYTQVLQQLLPLAHVTSIFKIVLITNGNPTLDIGALATYFVILAAVLAAIILWRRDISHYT